MKEHKHDENDNASLTCNIDHKMSDFISNANDDSEIGFCGERNCVFASADDDIQFDSIMTVDSSFGSVAWFLNSKIQG